MSLEERIALLTTSIDNLAAALANGKLAAPATEPTATTTKAKKEKPAAPAVELEVVLPTEEQMMEAGQRILTAGKKPKIAELNKKYGIERGRELLKDPAKKDQLVAYFNELKAIADAA